MRDENVDFGMECVMGSPSNRVQITVGLPFYNSEDTLLSAIRSIYAQTVGGWELLLINDGSTDRSLEIAQVVADSDSRVVVYSDGLNRGLAYRLNQITQLARGHYIARMDADDMMHPERLARQVAFMEENPRIDIVGTGLYAIDAKNCPFSVHFYNVGENVIKSLFEHRMIMHPTILGRTTWFRANPYDEKYKRSQDQELWARTHHKTQFANIEQPLFFYRMLPAEERENTRKRLQLYIASFDTERLLYRRYGPEIGTAFTIRLLLESYLKEIGYRVATKFGLQNTLRRFLVFSRFSPLDEQEMAIAEKAINEILATPVPGLSKIQRRLPVSRETA